MSAPVSLSAAAGALGLNKSTISRYLDKYPELNRATPGAPPRVDVEELRRHREAHVDAARAGSHAGRLIEVPASAIGTGREAAEEAEDGAGESRAGAGASYARAKTVHMVATAKRAQLDLQERLGRTAAIEEVERAGFELGLLVREQLDARREALAEDLAGLTDPAIAAARLDQADRQLLMMLDDALGRGLRRDAADA